MESFGETIKTIILNEQLYMVEHTEEIELIGCSASEIDTLQNAQNVSQLSVIYRELMAAIGKSGMSWLCGGSAEYEDVRLLKSKLSRLQSIPNDAFFFFSIEDAYFYFRTGDTSGDPAVLMYHEDEIHLTADTFSEFIMQKITMHRAVKQKWDRYANQ